MDVSCYIAAVVIVKLNNVQDKSKESSCYYKASRVDKLVVCLLIPSTCILIWSMLHFFVITWFYCYFLDTEWCIIWWCAVKNTRWFIFENCLRFGHVCQKRTSGVFGIGCFARQVMVYEAFIMPPPIGGLSNSAIHSSVCLSVSCW